MATTRRSLLKLLGLAPLAPVAMPSAEMEMLLSSVAFKPSVVDAANRTMFVDGELVFDGVIIREVDELRGAQSTYNGEMSAWVDWARDARELVARAK